METLGANGAIGLKHMKRFAWKTKQLGRRLQGLLSRTESKIKTIVKQLVNMRRNAMITESGYVAESLHAAIIVMKRAASGQNNV